MNLSEIGKRLDAANPARHEARFNELYALVHRLFARHHVAKIADLPEHWQRWIAAKVRAWDLKTPEELGTELDALGREQESLAVVRELHKLYDMPDPRPS